MIHWHPFGYIDTFWKNIWLYSLPNVLSHRITSYLQSFTSVSCNHYHATTMPLTPLENLQTFESLENLILQVNEHAAPQSYAVVILCTKKSKLKVIQKAWFICNWGQKHHNLTGEKWIHTTSRHIKCFFFHWQKNWKITFSYWRL